MCERVCFRLRKEKEQPGHSDNVRGQVQMSSSCSNYVGKVHQIVPEIIEIIRNKTVHYVKFTRCLVLEIYGKMVQGERPFEILCTGMTIFKSSDLNENGLKL